MHISNPAVRRARFCARVFAPLAAALILSPPARARLGDDFLDSGAYEREDILREFERLEPPPKPSAPAAAGGKKRIALVLPISETGAIGIAARALRDGFFAALERDGADVAVDVYDATTAADVVAAVAAAPARGARVIVGPLTRSAAAALARDLPAPEAPVVLLQERPEARARGYYSLSLSAGDEAAHLASTLPDLGYRRALLVIEESGFGARVGERFAQSWLRATERQAERFVIRRAPDWKRLFEAPTKSKVKKTPKSPFFWRAAALLCAKRAITFRRALRLSPAARFMTAPQGRRRFFSKICVSSRSRGSPPPIRRSSRATTIRKRAPGRFCSSGFTPLESTPRASPRPSTNGGKTPTAGRWTASAGA